MQTTTEQAPAAEAVVTPSTPKTITTTGVDGKEITIAVPRTIDEMQALFSRRDQLANQLENVTSRRASLVAELRSSPDGPARTGLEERLKVLDVRILQLERDLASTGQQLAAAPSDLARATEIATYPSGGDDFEEGVAAGVFPTAIFFGLVFLYRRWRRKKRGPEKPARAIEDNSGRLERLEQGMEAIAIEIERVSEGQRFVTKLLSDAHDRNERQLVGVERDKAT